MIVSCRKLKSKHVLLLRIFEIKLFLCVKIDDENLYMKNLYETSIIFSAF
jgi:hypothetical protein